MNKLWMIAACTAVMLAACTPDEPPPEAEGSGDAVEAPAVTNRIDIPAAVIQNLGITFAKVERRRVEQTLRAPGSFESPPDARLEYHTMLPGRVTVLVKQYQLVEVGTPLFSLEAPEWRHMQDGLATASGELSVLRTNREVLVAERDAAVAGLDAFPARFEALANLKSASQTHVARLQDARDSWQARVTELEELQKQGVGKASDLADARGSLKDAASSVAEEEEKLAELAERRVNLETEKKERELLLPAFDKRLAATDQQITNAEAAFQRGLRSAAGVLGIAPDQLVTDDAWRTFDTITITATGAGTVNHVRASSGAWVPENTEIVSTLDLSILRFRARGMQADLGLLKDGLLARVIAPQGGTLNDSAPAEGVLHLPTEADPDERMLDLLVTIENPPAWARPGVSAEVEIVWDSTAEPMLALPNRAIVSDGLDKIFFVRDFRDPSKVIRTVSLLGISDGRWTVVDSGVMEGSEVVIEGVYELKLTGAGKTEVEGHFHADGTFHAGSHSGDE